MWNVVLVVLAVAAVILILDVLDVAEHLKQRFKGGAPSKCEERLRRLEERVEELERRSRG